MNVEDLFMVPPTLFVEDKPFTLIDIPFSEKTENKSKDLIKKLHHLTNGKYQFQ